jgi:hypothetical protein
MGSLPLDGTMTSERYLCDSGLRSYQLPTELPPSKNPCLIRRSWIVAANCVAPELVRSHGCSCS